MSEPLPTPYKFVTSEMRSPMGSGTWALGKWRSVRGDLVPCKNGLHVATVQSLLTFADARLYRVEVGDEYIWHGEGADRKLVSRRMRLVERVEAWNDRTVRLFAADCAERVLPLFERAHPNDSRPREAIAVARRYANGEATADELAAAGGAAWAAAGGAAGAAAWAAAWAAAGGAAWAAAWAAAGGAAWAAAGGAAGGAAWAAAWAAERDWQARHLAETIGLPWESGRE